MPDFFLDFIAVEKLTKLLRKKKNRLSAFKKTFIRRKTCSVIESQATMLMPEYEFVTIRTMLKSNL